MGLKIVISILRFLAGNGKLVYLFNVREEPPPGSKVWVNRRVGHPILDPFHPRNAAGGNEHCLPLFVGIDEPPEMDHTVLDGDVRVGWRGGPLVPAHLLKQSLTDLAVAYRCAGWRGRRQGRQRLQEICPADDPHQPAVFHHWHAFDVFAFQDGRDVAQGCARRDGDHVPAHDIPSGLAVRFEILTGKTRSGGKQLQPARR